MYVELNQLKTNPFRDLIIDPIDEEAVITLTKSIQEDGFWGGVVVRQNDDGDFEIAAGHHRIKAAIQAGIKTADLFIGEIDDPGMIRIYAKENSTQRGNGSTAVAGTVASAIRFLSKAMFLGSGDFARTEKSRQDLGRDSILEFLEGIPGINESTIKAQLANLKESGDYARIIREVEKEIEEEIAEEQERIRKIVEAEEKARIEAEAEAERQAEIARKAAIEAEKRAAEAKRLKDEAASRQAEADAIAARRRIEEAEKRKAAEAEASRDRKARLDAAEKQFDAIRVKASKAADKAEEREVTFDFEGVAKYFKNENQVRVFRELVTSPGVKPYLSVENQANVARMLKEHAEKAGSELSGAFIKATLMEKIMGVYSTRDKIKREENKAQLEAMQREQRLRLAQEDFSRGVRTMSAAATEIHNITRSWPKGEAMPVIGQFQTALVNLQQHNLIPD
jgi:ParB/RepB/Spo0J family partition protein